MNLTYLSLFALTNATSSLVSLCSDLNWESPRKPIGLLAGFAAAAAATSGCSISSLLWSDSCSSPSAALYYVHILLI